MESLEAGQLDGRDVDRKTQGKIAEAWWHPGWIPFAEDSGGNMICIDTAPGPKGVHGQILLWEKETGPEMNTAKSFREWLAEYCVALEQGVCVVDDDGFLEPANG